MQKNRIEIAGMLATKPEVRLLPSGTRVANVRLAEDYFHRDKDGKLISHTNWYNLAFYEQMSGIAATYEKGDNIFVEGNIEQRKIYAKRRQRTDDGRGGCSKLPSDSNTTWPIAKSSSRRQRMRSR